MRRAIVADRAFGAVRQIAEALGGGVKLRVHALEQLFVRRDDGRQLFDGFLELHVTKLELDYTVFHGRNA